jgi:hypothetical protein
MRANGRILWLDKAYVELGILLGTLLHGAGILLPLLGGHGARGDAGGLAAGDAHGGAGGGECCSAGDGVHFEYVSRRVRGCLVESERGCAIAAGVW